MVRYAFSMIELIFALVIMGIVFITLPLVLLTDSASSERGLVQEAIFASSTKLGQVLTYPWDENSPDPAVLLSATHVVGTPGSGAPAALDRNATTDFRIGHFIQPLHRRMTANSSERNATAIGADVAGVMDDIDDFHNVGTTELISFTSQDGYKKAYRVTTTVGYINDANFLNATTYASTSIDFVLEDNTTVTAAANATNIKVIQVSTDQNNSNTGTWDPILVLRTYSTNIGETDYYKRTY